MEQKLVETANENMVPFTGGHSFTELEEDDRPALKIRLEFKNGNRYFFPYAYLTAVEYDVTGMLKLYTSEKEILITGRGLHEIEEHLYDNRIKVIKESKLNFPNSEKGLYIKSIEINDRRSKDEQ